VPAPYQKPCLKIARATVCYVNNWQIFIAWVLYHSNISTVLSKNDVLLSNILMNSCKNEKFLSIRDFGYSELATK
jgi:hypothetical protein